MAERLLQKRPSTIAQNSWVMKAIVLHDIKSRFFGNGFGQIMILFWPFVHIVALLLIYYASGRAPPYGSSAALYCATGVIPFIVFSYTSRWMVFAPVQNKSFTQYPIVKVLDVIIGRAILEVMTQILVTAIVIVVLSSLSIDCRPADLVQAVFAFGASLLVAVGMGFFNAAIASVLNSWITVYAVSMILFYASSAILFVPASLPANLRYILSFNPSLQIVEWMRSAYYINYPKIILDRQYTIGFGFFSVCLGLVLERVLRPYQRA